MPDRSAPDHGDAAPKADRPLKVAMVTARSLPFMGGIETHVEEVARRIAARGIQLTVLTTDVTGRLPVREQRGGFVVERFPAWPRSKDYYLAPGLLRGLAAGHYDVAHVQGVHNAVAPLALAVAHLKKLPVVVTLHTGGHSSPLRNALRETQWRLEAPLLRRAAKLIAVCEFEIDEFSRHLRLGKERFALIRNGSEALPVGVAPPELTGAPLILSIGRLERYKGHHRVIAAMPHVLAVVPSARLVVVGHGGFEGELRAQAARLGVTAAVAFRSFGPDEREALGALLASSDVVTLLSEYEAHPVAVMEALAAGVDVVVAGTSGLRELGRAGLVEVVELDADAEITAKCLLDASSARRWSTGPPALSTWDDCVDALVGTYEEVARCGS